MAHVNYTKAAGSLLPSNIPKKIIIRWSVHITPTIRSILVYICYLVSTNNDLTLRNRLKTFFTVQARVHTVMKSHEKTCKIWKCIWHLYLIFGTTNSDLTLRNRLITFLQAQDSYGHENLKMHFTGIEKSWSLGRMAEVMERSWNSIFLVQVFPAVWNWEHSQSHLGI